ncbi:MAG: sigma-70 family RNA polymerase sigma factor [Bacteroidetes bacterium]|nr:sigma-70 family RNA polymerase sigma factor [Bacteroidota bacterium]
MKEQNPTYQLLSGRSEASVKTIYERYGKKLFLFAKHKWKMNEDDSWDVVYKTLYRVIDTYPGYKFASEEKFSAFVFTIFINYLRNFYRDRKNLPGEITELDENFSEAVIESETSISPVLHLLVCELDQLEDWERILLLMRSQDVPYAEIAKFIDKPEEQLKVYYQRLKKKLSEKLIGKIYTSKTGTHGNHGK